MKKKIYITRKISNQFIEKYADKYDIEMWESESKPVPRDLLLEKAQEVDALCTMLSDKVDEELLAKQTQLKVVANLAVGYDNIDVLKANQSGVTVTNTPGVLSDTTADLTFSLLMATARRIVEADSYLRAGKWQDWSPFLLAGSDIHHKTIGIVGMGRIGKQVAKRASGFDMNIVYHNRSRNKEAEGELGAQYLPFDQLIQQADFIVSLLPLTDETHELFDSKAFEQMKETAIFINVSRGAVVDEKALYEALKQGQIKGAGLDVFTKEPIDMDHPFLSLDNVVLLPHIGSASTETRSNMINLCLENIDAVLSGKEALTEVK
ncbi:MAG TPA: D-glycerate dehydrogenase [Pseudogracilibacillus sp.]|nr:D-glycerate dehydrogenase [Pseudogracilibacillus sp.]